MKAISLWQPWASLMVLGAKRIETRSWYTDHRGPLLIHAAKRKNIGELSDVLEQEEFRSALKLPILDLDGDLRKQLREDIENLPYGALLGTVNMVDCVPTEKINRETLNMPCGTFGDWSEWDFGNYMDGRYGWICEKPVKFEHPIAYKGEQGLFDVDTRGMHLPPWDRYRETK